MRHWRRFMDKPPMGLEGSGAFRRPGSKGLEGSKGGGGAPFIYRRRPLMKKPLQPPCGRGNASPPLVAGATTFPPRWEACHWILSRLRFLANPVPLPPLRGGTITRAYCRDAYEKNVSRCFILPPLAGEVRRSRIGGGERSEPISRMLIIPYDIESQSRNADFILIARRAIRHLQRRRRCRPLSESDAQRTHFALCELDL